LRALENRVIERLGGTQSIPVDVRVISATHRDLPAEIAAGRFREDLYYRLRVVTLDVPPLRARKEDIPMLADAFLGLHSAKLAQSSGTSGVPDSRKSMKLARETNDALLRYDWPGNVRELKNSLERALIFANGTEVLPADLPPEITGEHLPAVYGAKSTDSSALTESDFRDAKRKFEILYITRQLERHNWNVSRTAAAIGLHRQSLQEKLRELGITRPGRAAAVE
jgi:two-component system nitrogen regulation response regulator NtrX